MHHYAISIIISQQLPGLAKREKKKEKFARSILFQNIDTHTRWRTF
jgi:hypothetical protein